MLIKYIAGSFLLFMVFITSNSLAQGSMNQDSMNQELAQKHYELADKLYQTSNYPEALIEFQKAYQLKPMPELLFNIARCHEVMANLEQAIQFYRKYLQEKPTADNSTLVNARIQNLQKRLEKKSAATRAEAQTHERQVRIEQAHAEQARAKQARLAQGHTKQAHDQQAALTDQPQLKESNAGGDTSLVRSSPGWIKPVGWTMLAVGGASLVAGIVFGLQASDKSSEFTDGVATNKTYDELNQIDASGKQYQSVQIATIVAGSLLTAAGGGLLIWNFFRGQSPVSGEAASAASSFAPLFTPTSVGLMGVVRY